MRTVAGLLLQGSGVTSVVRRVLDLFAGFLDVFAKAAGGAAGVQAEGGTEQKQGGHPCGPRNDSLIRKSAYVALTQEDRIHDELIFAGAEPNLAWGGILLMVSWLCGLMREGSFPELVQVAPVGGSLCMTVHFAFRS